MSSRPGLVVGVSAGLLLLAAGLLFWLSYERYDYELDRPPQGAARYNPLYALQKTLEGLGHTVLARPSLHWSAMQVAPGELIVLGSDLRTLGAADSARLLAWVAGGGHLLFALPPSRAAQIGALLEQLDADLIDSGECLALGSDDAAQFCPPLRLRPRDEGGIDWHWASGTAELGYLLGRAEHGAGSWQFAGSFDFLSRDALGQAAHRALAWQLLGPVLAEAPPRIHLIYAVDVPPLYVLLVREAWPLLLPLLLALLAWLWARAQRFGPLLPLPPADRRALLEHIQAAAALSLRRGRGEVLHAALKRRFLRRLERQHPSVAALAEIPRIAAIAAATGCDPGQVRDALLPSDLQRPESFRRAVHALHHVMTRL